MNSIKHHTATLAEPCPQGRQTTAIWEPV